MTSPARTLIQGEVKASSVKTASSSDRKSNPGKLVTFYGPMSSGKSTQLFVRLSTNRDTGERVLCVAHPDTCNREGTKTNRGLSTHNSTFKELNPKVDVIITDNLRDIDAIIDNYDCIGIDECHFFKEEELVKYCKEWYLFRKKEVIVAGINSDYRGDAMGGISALNSIATEPIRMTARCYFCMQEANKSSDDKKNRIRAAFFTVSLIKLHGRINPGGLDIYKPACDEHFFLNREDTF